MQEEIIVRWFGWNTDDGSDKIWGWVSVITGKDVKNYRFWGPRRNDKTSKIKFKREADGAIGIRSLLTMQEKKNSNGYKSVPVYSNNTEGSRIFYPEIEKIYPEFSNHVIDELLIGKLTGSILTDK